MDEIKLLKKKAKAQAEGNTKTLISISTDLAELYKSREKYEKAIEEYGTLAEIYKKERYHIEYAKVNRGIGEIYFELQDFRRALNHFKIYLNIATEQNDKIEIQRAYATIGNLYLNWDNTRDNLQAAYKFFIKSMKLSENLTGISSYVKADMQARLLANLGLVKDSLGDYVKAEELLNTSINICKSNDIYEQLIRGHSALASLYEKKGDSSKAINQYSLAVEAAMKMKDSADRACCALLAKAQALIKLGDFHASKKTLYKAYKLNSPVAETNKTIKTYLKNVIKMCRTEDKLIIEHNDSKQLKKLYETMGDCSCDLKHYPKALEYYKLMLEHAEKSGAGSKEMASCYYSLAATYRDNKMYPEALEYYEREYLLCTKLEDNLNTLSHIADTKEEAGCLVDDIEAVYKRALENCRRDGNVTEERRMVNRCMAFLRRANGQQYLSEYSKLLNSLEVVPIELEESSSDNERPSSSDSDSEEVDLSDVTVSDDSDGGRNAPQLTTGKRRFKTFIVKRNAKGESQLHRACIEGKMPVVKHLLDQGHPVNVRDHTGWLPLHEACNHGNYDIAELLLDNGASINDRGGVQCEGITPIYDAASNGHIRIVQLLMDRGASVTIKSDRGDTPLNVLKSRHRKYPFIDEEYRIYLGLVERMKEALTKAGETVLDEVRPISHECIESEEIREAEIDDEPAGLLDEYRGILDELSKKSSYSERKDERKPRKDGKRGTTALIEEDQGLSDDWLEDDIGRVSKKRRFGSLPCSSTSLRVSPPRRTSDENNGRVAAGIPTNNSPVRTAVASTSKSPVGVAVASTSKSPVGEKPTKTLHRYRSDGGLNGMGNLADSYPDGTSPDDFMTYVDVKIDDKIFRVPVLSSQIRTNAIGWLADRAAEKYAKKEGSKPCLELETITGALLSNDDPLSLLFPLGSRQAEIIVGRISKFHVILLADRYREACTNMNETINEALAKQLEEMSVNLSVRNEGYLSSDLAPLCRIIGYQPNLIHLDLSGNFLTANCVAVLCTALPLLANLQSLNLSCTTLAAKHMAEMAKMFSNCNSGAIPLRNLRSLDLSANNLNNQSMRHLADITSRLKLDSLNLSNDDLSEGAFDFEWRLESVRELDVSFNRLVTRDVDRLISGLDKRILKRLDVSRNLFESFESSFEDAEALEYFGLVQCGLRDGDVHKLLRIPSREGLVMNCSFNEELTGVSLRRLLESPLFKEINLVGCTRIFEYLPENFDYNFKKNSRLFLKLSDINQHPSHVNNIRDKFQRAHENCTIERTLDLLILQS
ncbi:unnamed protein product [Phyllotreta striolata]|uniref:Tonsoku-like protein n=1 Tax=Phyllotreta striolata TaxID=444603 RepID=A0A9N9XP73_PHYSR|nr:unnamed protein product [Phyllotreta striolata]